jgi:hypothetical protein
VRNASALARRVFTRCGEVREKLAANKASSARLNRQQQTGDDEIDHDAHADRSARRAFARSPPRTLRVNAVAARL